MSDTLGPIQYGRGSHQVFLGRDIGEDRNYSEEIASKIDAEVRRIIDESYSRAKTLLTDNWKMVERMVASLLENETVEADEVLAIVNDMPFDQRKHGPPAATPPRPTPAFEPEPKPKRLPPTISPEPA
jgi:cell division protease FtsH